MQGTDMYKNKYVQVWVVACVHTGRPALVVISLGLVCQRPPGDSFHGSDPFPHQKWSLTHQPKEKEQTRGS